MNKKFTTVKCRSKFEALCAYRKAAGAGKK